MNQQMFDEHALWATLSNLKEMLSGDLAGGEEEGRDEIRFLHSVVQYVDSLKGTDTHLLDDATLTSIDSELAQARDHLSTYLDDREANANILVSSVMPAMAKARDSAIRTMPAPTSDEGARAAQEATDRYRDTADTEIARLRDRIQGLQNRLGELEELRTTDLQEAQQSLSGLQEKITDGEQRVAAHATELKAQIDSQRNAFTNESEQRESTFRDAEAARETTAKEQQDRQSEQASALVDNLEEYRNGAKALLDSTNRDVVSGDYQGWANKQGEVASKWNIAAVAIGLLTVGALVWVVLGARNDSVQFLLSKSSVGLIGLILAGYAARQASEHRAEERMAKRLALDLAALEPFLEHVENPEQLRTEIAKRVFAPEQRASEERRFSLGKRGMSVTELAEFVRVIRSPPSDL